MKIRLHCLIKNCISLAHCFSKGFPITFGQLRLKQSSASRSKCLPQLHYVHSRVTSRGPKRILYLLVVGETDMTFFLTKGRQLNVVESMYARQLRRSSIRGLANEATYWKPVVLHCLYLEHPVTYRALYSEILSTLTHR